jgi:predicted Zn-dependent peptidase
MPKLSFAISSGGIAFLPILHSRADHGGLLLPLSIHEKLILIQSCMKTLKNILTTIALLITVQFSYGQSSAMKAPVSYKLKNGMTIILAENSATKKVFSLLSFEGTSQYSEDNAAVQELVHTILTQQLPELNEGLSLTEKGINLATTADQFENAMAAMYTYVSAPEFSEEALSKAKAVIIAHINVQDKYYPEQITVAAVKKLSVTDVKQYYTQIANPATAYLTVAGNFNPSIIKSYAKKGFNQFTIANKDSQLYLASMFN